MKKIRRRDWHFPKTSKKQLEKPLVRVDIKEGVIERSDIWKETFP